ncbi:MAG: tetratricopeptide repeat protein [Kofleriaceae bacterium]
MKRAIALLLLAACTHHAQPVPMRQLGKDAYAHYLNGRFAIYKEDYATAVTELQAAIAAAPDQPTFAIELAHALAKAKRVPEANAVMTDARAKWPDHSQVWLVSGELLEKDQPADAARAYRRSIELEDGDEKPYLGLVRIAIAQKDDRQAEVELRQLVAKVPTSTDGHYKLAQRLTGDDQIKELRIVLEQDPDQIDARLDLARALRRSGKLDEAIVQTRNAFDRAAQPLDIADELFWLLCEADDRQAAIDLLTLLDDDRSDLDALATVLRMDLGLGRITEAQEIVARVAAQDAEAGALAQAELHLSTLELDKKGEPLAVADVAAIPEDSQRFPQARRIAALALVAAQQPQRALEMLEPVRKAKPKDLELAFIAATAAADSGAVEDGRALLKSFGDTLDAQLARARFEDHVHAEDAALKLLVPIVTAHPDNSTALNLAGYLLADRKQDLDRAEQLLKHARELSPGDPAVLDSWGWLLLQRGRTRDAIRALDHASRFSPREPEILLHLATAWAADKQPKTAAKLLDQAVALRPLPDVKRRIDALRSTLVIK